MDFSLSMTAGDLIVSAAAAALAWYARSVLVELRRTVRRVDHVEAWAIARFGYAPRDQ
jgi:hypothetical protein